MDMQIDYQKLAGALLAQQGFGASASQPGLWQPGFDQQAGLSYKADVSATASAVYGHGPGGLFSYPGMDKRVFSAMILPIVGLQALLPVRPNNENNPMFGIFTGVVGTTGTEPAGPCDDPLVAGLSKLCMHTFVWGRQSRQTRVFDLTEVGRVTNRSDFLDYQLLGNALGVNPNPNVPAVPGGVNWADVGKNEMAKATFELAVAWSRDFAKELYTGNPTNNTAQNGRMYFYGLDILINTGYRDAITGVACAAADSLVRSFGDLRIDQGSNGTTLVNTLTFMYRNLSYIAEQAGLNPAKWVIAMRWGLFYEITRIWPIAYYTNRNTITGANANQSVFNSGESLQKIRDDMYRRKFLLIDGEEVPVVVDNAIAETEPAAGVYESQVYIVPMTVLGNVPVTYLESFNFDAPGAGMDFARVFAPDGSFYTSDGGRFIWNRPAPTNVCVQLRAWTKPRLMMLTPHIAGRLTDVRYSPLIHERDAFAEDSYWVDGGGTNYTGHPGVAPSLFSPVP
jgi:hypothetical protein